MESQNKFILVTGGAGYIGSHTVVALLEKGYSPIIIDDFRNSKKEIIQQIESTTKQKFQYFSAACQDVFRIKDIFEQFPIEGIIHFAADKAVGESVENPLKYFDNNLSGLVKILQIAKEYNVKNFVFSSSCTVYGIPENIPVKEDAPVSYNSPYGFTKKINEEMIVQFIESHPKMNATLLRYFNPIGAHESGMIGELPLGTPNNLLPFITQTAAGKRKQLTVFGDDYDTPDGTCIRDYIHVMDLAEAHIAALEQISLPENPAIYNIGTGNGTSVLEMIQQFEEVTGQKVPYSIGKRREGDVPEIFANADKANQLLNWKAKRSIKEAISSAWKFEKYIENKNI